MKNLLFKYIDGKRIIEEFGEDEVNLRYKLLFEQLEEFIKANNLENIVSINRMLLANVVVDYFYDILRIKSLHTDIEKVNSEKVIAYTSYWLLQKRVLTFKITEDNFNESLATINERFVLQYITDYLSVRIRKEHIVLREEKGIQNFVKSLLYYFAYRKYDAQSIEMIIIAFMAGQIYERDDQDISSEMHPYDLDAK